MAQTGDFNFISIETRHEAECFLVWLDKQDKYPFSFYLDGISYTMLNDTWKQAFYAGYYSGVECAERFPR